MAQISLREYLFKHRIKQKDFAKLCGIRPNQICLYVGERAIPTAPKIALIEAATNGEVGFETNWVRR